MHKYTTENNSSERRVWLCMPETLHLVDGGRSNRVQSHPHIQRGSEAKCGDTHRSPLNLK